MTTQTVAAAFDTYRAEVLPADAGPTQISECRRAFFAGAYFLLMELATAIDEDTPDEAGIAYLEQLKAEIETFAAAGGPAPTPPPIAPPIHYTIPDRDDMRARLRALGATIGTDLPAGWGFNLLLFTYGEKGDLLYISSAVREDVINVMREFIRKSTS